jgi:rhamnopyranosyl-N-acetylglucosaminyl-diphospho-decaprenol beta-1,3/1,4-galactofuranosyltransferase
MKHTRYVCAVIYAEPPSPLLDELLVALAGQTVSPREILMPVGLMPRAVALAPDLRLERFRHDGRESSFAAGVRAALAMRADWVWLLDGWTVPSPTALHELLSVADSPPGPRPLLLASRVLDGAGRLHPDALPTHEIFEKQYTVQAVERHLVALRTAAHGSVLLAADALTRFGAVRSGLLAGADMVELSARILRGERDIGYLVPKSVAVRRAAPRAPSWRSWSGRVQILASSGWSPRERLWEAFRLVEELTGTR